MSPASLRSGYVFLVTTIVIGSIAALTTVTLLMLGWAAEQNGQVHVRTNQALEMANTCVERAFENIRQDVAYAGGTTYTYQEGECTVYAIAGTGDGQRDLCVRGVSGDSERTVQIRITKVFPKIEVDSWSEVSCCTLEGSGAPSCTSSSSTSSSSSSSQSSESSDSSESSSESSTSSESSDSSAGSTGLSSVGVD